MRNPFEKHASGQTIAFVAAGGLGAAALAYLYLTESGKNVRQSVAHKFLDEAKSLIAELVSKKSGIGEGTVKTVADHVAK